MNYARLLILSAVATVVAATGGLAAYIETPGWSLLDAEQAAGHQLFKDHCAACHAPKPGARVVLAPSLKGVLDRPAGSLPGFPYSNALKKSGLVWSQDNLRRWIADSERTIPNTLMPHVSIADPAEQLYLIAYLSSLKGAAKP